MDIYLSLLVALVGVLMWALATNSLLKEIGKIAFTCGLLVFLLRVSGSPVSILK